MVSYLVGTLVLLAALHQSVLAEVMECYSCLGAGNVTRDTPGYVGNCVEIDEKNTPRVNCSDGEVCGKLDFEFDADDITIQLVARFCATKNDDCDDPEKVYTNHFGKVPDYPKGYDKDDINCNTCDDENLCNLASNIHISSIMLLVPALLAVFHLMRS